MALIIEVKVVPQSGKNGWKLESGRLKCYLKSAPERGKANSELIDLIAKALNIPKYHVTIISGATIRLKCIKIEAPVSFDRLVDALGIQQQIGLF